MTKAEKEAKFLYDEFYQLLDYEEIGESVKRFIAKDAARTAAVEMKKRSLMWASKDYHDTIKDYFRQLHKAINIL